MLSLALAVLALQATPAAPPAATAAQPAAARWPSKEGDVTLRDFRFRSGETMAELRIHYTTLGTPRRNARGEIDNAVMLLHGTGGSGRQFFQPQFADELFGPGQPLDITRYYIILPDNIGHGGSSKPSDGLRMRFPQYDYDDMVEAQRRMLVDGLGITRLRLIFGTSMGCMHAFVWGEAHPGFASALMPMACQPVQIAGVNRMWRQAAIDAIRADPAWNGGNYTSQPLAGLRTVASLSVAVGSAPLLQQKLFPERDAAIAHVRARLESDIGSRDANDSLYQYESSRNYNPWPNLEKITVPVTWINSADDFINPRNATFPADALKRMPNAQFRLIAETDETRGHSTHSWAVFWKDDLVALLKRSGD
ncbi:alpha/beta fold hydrolase [Sphingomonas flavalba]|uniref:alpha/beta fold hydrolase n=1 Tax=Sphingomonas flavalba TaxID=2559804 RepID=UPI0039E137AF